MGMTTYAALTDQLLTEPFYGDHFENQFGITIPENTSLTPTIMNMTNASAEDRVTACIQVVVTHRAFERTFLRLEKAIHVWMRSFAREVTGLSVRTSWKPCQKVFNKLADIDK